MSDNSPGSGPTPPNDPIDGPGDLGPDGSNADLPTEPMPITGETPIDPNVDPNVDPSVEPTQAMPVTGGPAYEDPVYGTDPTVPIATGAAVGAAGGVPPGGTIPPGGTVPPGGPGDPPPPPWYQRNGAVLGVVAGLLAVALLILLLIWIFGGDDDDDDLTGDTTVPTTVVTSTSAVATTVPPTTVPATTVPPTTVPPTTAPPTTVPPTTVPPTTAPPTTEAPTTTTAPTTTVATTTTPPTTAPPVVPDPATPFEVLEANPEQFSTLVSLLERVGLDTDLQQSGEFTILAPTNDAFADVDLGGLNDQQVTDILLHHVVPQSLDRDAVLASGPELDTLNGPVEIGDDTVGGASFVDSFSNLPAEGADPTGWVHAIDAVLTP